MHFSIACTDKPDALPVRQANRPDHVAYLEAAGDPYAKAGIFASVTITAVRPVFGSWTENDG